MLVEFLLVLLALYRHNGNISVYSLWFRFSFRNYVSEFEMLLLQYVYIL